MIAERALQLAGPRAVLAHRPHPAAVLHVYVGPLTPSARSIPRAGRAVCNQHTRRLYVQRPSSLSTLTAPGAIHRRVCSRCSRHLLGMVSPQVPAPQPVTRADHLARYAGITAEQLVHDLEFAQTTQEVDAVGFVSLLLLGDAGCRRPVLSRADRTTLNAHLAHHRRRVTNTLSRVDVVLDQVRPEVAQIRRGRVNESRMVREERVRRLGITTVQPRPRGAQS